MGLPGHQRNKNRNSDVRPSGGVRDGLARKVLAPSGACTRRGYENIRPFDCDAGTLHYELGSQDAMRSGSNLSYSSLTGAQTIHGAKWTANLALRLSPGWLDRATSDSEVAENANTARNRADSSAPGPIYRRPPSNQYKASGSVFFVTFLTV